MNKLEVQQRVLQYGKPLDLDKFEWNEKTNTFSTLESSLILDFRDIDACTFNTASDCTFNTGYNCKFDTGYNCTFNTSYNCIFKTGSDCVIVRRDVFEVIQPKDGETIQLLPHDIAGYLVNGKLNGVPHIIADGILSKIISKKGSVYKVLNRNEINQSYLVEREYDGKKIYSHGKTIKEARDSLIYKIGSRDTSQYKDLTLDTILTKAKAIEAYRVITGACEEGTKYFINNLKKVKSKYKIKEIIDLTKGQFGNEAFKRFFQKKVEN